MSKTLGALLRAPADKALAAIDKRFPAGLVAQVNPDRIVRAHNDDGTTTDYGPGELMRVDAREAYDLLRAGAITPPKGL